MPDRPTLRSECEIAVTPGMIEAGIDVIESSFGGLRDPLLRIERPDLVCAVYVAMRKTAAAAG